MHDDAAGRPADRSRATAGARPSLRRLLLWNLALSLTAILVAGGVGVGGELLVADASEELVDTVVPARRNNLLMLQHLLDAETGLRGFVDNGEQPFLEPFTRGRREFPAAVADQRGLALGSEAAAIVDAQEALGRRWFTEYADPVRSGVDIDPEVGKTIFDEYRSRTTELSRVLEVDRSRLARDLERIPMVTSATIVLVVLTFVVLTLVQARRARRLAVRPLEELRATVAALEAGDRHARSSVTAAAEIEAVGHALNLLADESQRHRADSERRLATGRAVQTITGRIHAALDAGTVLEATAADLGRLLAVHRVLVLTLVGRRAMTLADWSAPATGAPIDPSMGDDLDDLSLLASEPYRGLLQREGGLYLDDVAQQDLPADIAGVLTRHGARAVGVSPVRAGSEVLAVVLLIDRDGPRPWSLDDRRCIAEVTGELGTALTHARLYQRELDMVEQLRALDQSKDDFVSTVSHELRTPLTSIVGYLELLRDGDAGEVSADQDRMLAVVERNTERLLGLIADLLMLSKIDSGHLGNETQRVPLGELIHATVAAVSPVSAGKGHEVEVDVALDGAEVEGDPVQLEQVFLNLVSNAAKFTPDGGRVTICARVEGDEVVVDVADTGIGIPEEEQGRLFERFFRSSTALANAIPGTGLGLAIVHGIVERHGGRTTVESTPGTGTRITVRLPCAPLPDRDQRAPGVPGIDPRQHESSTS